ncbi:hypothetical protein OK016_08820 [Vibrio chagasii]|nr:hypothetical protein [Vibrio chagasii]
MPSISRGYYAGYYQRCNLPRTRAGGLAAPSREDACSYYQRLQLGSTRCQALGVGQRIKERHFIP